jgi:hypothetical protein
LTKVTAGNLHDILLPHPVRTREAGRAGFFVNSSIVPELDDALLVRAVSDGDHLARLRASE